MIDIDISKELYGAEGIMAMRVKLKIENNSFLAITGSSGSGKTTLLRIIAGLEKANGTIKVDNEIWLSHTSFLPVQKRRIGFVFQEYALFENMTIEQNLLFVNKDIKLAEKLLKITELLPLKDRYPTNLSGGQKQRVALCRAMMNNPRILLLDEPLSALDWHMREKLHKEILQLHKEFGTTTVMVSHDPSEIYKLANRVAVMKDGSIEKEGNPSEVLLKSNGSQKFSFEGEIVDIYQADIAYIAVVAIGRQLVEVVVTKNEAKSLKKGSKVKASVKAFTPTLSRI